ncbi:hypothetical protein EXIGLDRAFT_683039 [Exidia glandulosa HHB12029]|uniref:Large ribosomal subunit protein mL54 n=1 Tax=Exidia glandulosa HHB12029 TaxID=1314781 RepID=A0A165DD98_EXIGL|nr:hypothetical protein EXIGLDRAFT_683039 [Exidia glandulosa HHB12029]
MRAALHFCSRLAARTSSTVPRRPFHVSCVRRAANDAPAAEPQAERPVSSCPPSTVLVGLNWLKGQPPVLALPDEEYPPWLWTITSAKPIPDDGPGGKGEKMRMRIENRKRIKEQNFMSKQ